MKKIALLFFVSASLFCSCSPRIGSTISLSRPSLGETQIVEIFGLGEEIPDGGEYIGFVSIDDTGFTINCSYDVVMRIAANEARKMGGNVIHILSHKRPDFWSSCHRITVDVLYFEDVNEAMRLYVKSLQMPKEISDSYGPLYTGDYQRSRHRMGIDITYSSRIGKPIDDFAEKMRDGVSYGIDYHYFPMKEVGFGVKIMGHNYSHEENGLKDNLNTMYIAPSISVRNYTKKNRNAWVLSFSCGYVGYFETISDGEYTDNVFASNLSATGAIGYDIRLGNGNTFLGLSAGATYGHVPVRGYKESIMAMELGVGLRF